MTPRRIKVFLLSAKNGWNGEGVGLRPLWRFGDLLLSAIGEKRQDANCDPNSNNALGPSEFQLRSIGK